MPQEMQDYVISYTVQGVETGGRMASRGTFRLGQLLVKQAVEKGLQAVRNYQATHGGEISLAKLNKTVQKRGGQVSSGQIEIRDKDVDKFIKFCKDKMVKVAITKVQGAKDTYTVYASSQNWGNLEAALYQYKTMLEKGEPLSDRVQRETQKIKSRQRTASKAANRGRPTHAHQKSR